MKCIHKGYIVLFEEMYHRDVVSLVGEEPKNLVNEKIVANEGPGINLSVDLVDLVNNLSKNMIE